MKILNITQPIKHRKQLSLTILRFVFIVFFVVAASCITTQISQSSNSPGATVNGTSIKQVLINQEFEGSTAQSTALMELIENNPQYIDYQVSKELVGETILFGCNMEKKALIRIHQRKDGTGSQEMWRDHIIYRLNSSKGGGSLNDTPQGKIPGSFQAF